MVLFFFKGWGEMLQTKQPTPVGTWTLLAKLSAHRTALCPVAVGSKLHPVLHNLLHPVYLTEHQLGVVVHTCNLTSQEGGSQDRRITGLWAALAACGILSQNKSASVGLQCSRELQCLRNGKEKPQFPDCHFMNLSPWHSSLFIA